MIDQWDAQITLWAAKLGWPLEGLLRLLLASLAGGLVGMERELRGRQAGFRTNLLVCLGSALVMIVSLQFAGTRFATVPGINLNIDPARIAYGVMTGIGFLGAGTIIHARGSIRGLTTAAGLWCVAAVGLSVGFGLYLLSALATGLIVLALWLLDYFEAVLPKVQYRTVMVRTPWKADCIRRTIERLKKAGLSVVDVNFRRSDDLQHVDVSARICFTNRQRYYDLERQLQSEEEYQLISAQES